MNRHERRKATAKTRTAIVAPAAARERLLAFIAAFRDAPNDADIDIRIGGTEDGEAAILVSISNGGGDHAMVVSEARKLASIMEDTMREFPNDPQSAELPNIIMGLRAACDKATQALLAKNGAPAR